MPDFSSSRYEFLQIRSIQPLIIITIISIMISIIIIIIKHNKHRSMLILEMWALKMSQPVSYRVAT